MRPLIIFDMDGVLVDSEATGIEASIAALAERGVTAAPSDFIEFTGMGDDAFIGGAARKHGLEYDPSIKERMYDIYETIADRVKVFPWSQKLLRGFIARGFAVSVASSSDRRKVLCNLARVGVRPDELTAFVTGSDVAKKKPDPEIFLRAEEFSRAVRPDIDPSRRFVYVCEDSLSGVAAAKAAGMICAAVTTSFPREKLLEAGADYVFDDLADFASVPDFKE
jgi:beta-phosphoglucomutase-like phosphatase (HAD superfamily)